MFSSSSRLPQRWQLLPLYQGSSPFRSLSRPHYSQVLLLLARKPPASLLCPANITQEAQEAWGSQHPISRLRSCLSFKSGNSLMHFRENGAICQRGRLSLEKDMHGGVCDFRNSSHPWPCSFPAPLCPSRSRVLSCCPPQTNSTR